MGDCLHNRMIAPFVATVRSKNSAKCELYDAMQCINNLKMALRNYQYQLSDIAIAQLLNAYGQIGQ